MEAMCQICHGAALSSSVGDRDLNEYECFRCGRYRITGTADTMLSRKEISEEDRLALSMWVFHNQGLEFDSVQIRKLPKVKRPKLHDRALALIRELARRYPRQGVSINIELAAGIVDGSASILSKASFGGLEPVNQDRAKTFFRLLSISWSRDGNELRYLLFNYMKRELNWLSDITHDGETHITPTGWRELEKPTYSGEESELGFVAMWFDPQTDRLWAKGIEPAITKAGYRAIRIDKEHFVNKIDDEIILRIRESRFIVADFTGARDAVSFESGFGLGLGLPVFYTCEKSGLKKVNFDQNHYPFIRWDNESLASFAEELTARIVAVLGPGPYYESSG